MKFRKFFCLFLVMLMVLLSLIGCKKSDDSVVIGYIGDLSGNDAYVGVPPQLFLEDYFAELNAKGGLLGKQVKLVSYDMQPDNAVDGSLACNRLINEDKATCHYRAVLQFCCYTYGSYMQPGESSFHCYICYQRKSNSC